MAAGEGHGAQGQAQQGLETEDLAQGGAGHVLDADEDTHGHQEDDEGLAALLQHAESGGEANAGEEDVHKHALQRGVNGELQYAGLIQDQVHDGVDNAADDGAGDAVSTEDGNFRFQKRAEVEDGNGKRHRLIQVKGQTHIISAPIFHFLLPA